MTWRKQYQLRLSLTLLKWLLSPAKIKLSLINPPRRPMFRFRGRARIREEVLQSDLMLITTISLQMKLTKPSPSSIARTWGGRPMCASFRGIMQTMALIATPRTHRVLLRRPLTSLKTRKPRNSARRVAKILRKLSQRHSPG